MSDYTFKLDTLPTNDEEVHEAFKAMYKDDLTVRNVGYSEKCVEFPPIFTPYERYSLRGIVRK